MAKKTKSKKMNKLTKYAGFIVIAAVLFMMYFSSEGNTAKFTAASRIRAGTITAPRPPVVLVSSPDLIPVAVKFNDGRASIPPEMSTTTVSVKNKGTGSASDVEILIKDAFNNNLGTCTISEIKAGETKTCDANYPYVYAPNYEHVYVDPNKKITETDETNNELAVNL